MAILSDMVKSLASDAVRNVGGNAIKATGAAAMGAGGAAVIAGAGTNAVVIAGTGATTLLAAEAISEADKQDRIDKIDHHAPGSAKSYQAGSMAGNASGSTNSERDLLIQGVNDLFEAGLVSIEEVSGPMPTSPEIHGCVPQQSARRMGGRA